MKNWDQVEEGGQCQADRDWEDVQRICDHLKIPRHRVNFVHEYWTEVFETMLGEFKRGVTPNPDILCNREIKFKALFERVAEFGGTHVATGHYCRVGDDPRSGRKVLLRGVDEGKDQSYFLGAVGEEALRRTLFPIGGMRKSEVKRIAREHGLGEVAERPESMGICFIGKRRFEDFIGQYIEQVPGELRLPDERIVGEHRGMCTLTIGQGAKVGGRPEKLFVYAKDVARNIIYVTPGRWDHVALNFVCSLTFFFFIFIFLYYLLVIVTQVSSFRGRVGCQGARGSAGALPVIWWPPGHFGARCRCGICTSLVKESDV